MLSSPLAGAVLREEAVVLQLVHRGLFRGWMHLSQSSRSRTIKHPHKEPFVLRVEKLGEWGFHFMGDIEAERTGPLSASS